MPKDGQNEMERMPTLSSPNFEPLHHVEMLRVRCPHCRKLYMVQFADIQEAKPRFECIQCHSRFWLALNEMDLSQELNGIPIEKREVPLKSSAVTKPRATEPCPKCFKPTEVGRTDCQHCGVIVEKFRTAMTFQDHVPPHSTTLEQMWRKILADFPNESLHREFLKACSREKNLPYAAAQYGLMQKLMPTDEQVLSRIKEIQTLALVGFPSVKETKANPRRMPRIWQFPLFAAVLLISVGLVFPMFRNMVGVGAAFLFFAIALQIQLRSRD